MPPQHPKPAFWIRWCFIISLYLVQGAPFPVDESIGPFSPHAVGCYGNCSRSRQRRPHNYIPTVIPGACGEP